MGVPQRHLFNLFEQQKAQLQQIIDKEGGAIAHEAHTGIRQKFGTYEPRIQGEMDEEDVISVESE